MELGIREGDNPVLGLLFELLRCVLYESGCLGLQL